MSIGEPTFYGTAQFQSVQSTCISTTTAVDDQKGAAWLIQVVGRGGGYSHLMMPNQKACYYNGGLNVSTDHVAIGASSYHPGGVSVLFLDGSVKFIKSSVSQYAWWAIATKDMGEVLSADSY